MTTIRLPILVALLVLVGLSGGCGGPSKVKVNGKIIQSETGKPLKDFPPKGKNDRFQLLLSPTEMGEGKSDHAPLVTIDGDNVTFEKPDVPSGKYKVVLTLPDGGFGADKLQGAFSKEKTPLTIDLNSSNPITIDLSKPELK